MKHLNWLKAVFPALALMASAGALAAQKPLLQEGKQTLYQRVLTYPGCELSAKVGEKGKVQPAFSRFYVYQRQKQGNEEWLRVGPDSYGNSRGWMKANCSVDWKMQLTLAFTNPSGRNPMLFFRDKTDVEKILNNAKPATQLQPLLSDLKAGKSVPSVLAREPDYMIDQQKNFYLLPVLGSDDIFTDTGYQVRVLNVASVSEAGKTASVLSGKNASTSPDKEKNMMKGFSASVVFVIDSTISMGPYIDRTKQAIEKIYQRIEKENLLGQVKFGLVAYRSNVAAVPGLEYDSKMYVDPNTVKDGKDFLAKVRDLKQATVSSSKVNEDAYAGVMTALDKVDWTKFGARYVILVTDAGALEGDDKLSSTQLDATQVRLEATYRGVALYALHLKTPSGHKNHASAENQYRDLTLNAFLHKPLYYPINSGDVNSFGTIVDNLANAITSQIKTAWRGEETVGSALGANESYMGKKAELSKQPLLHDAALLGHAMRLAYLGDKQGTQAPPVFKSWISDRDLVHQNIPATEVKVLLTKSELSDLSEVMKKVVNAANEGLISPDDMFASLRSLAATMGNDPKQAKNKQATKLGEMGLLGEYIEGLPYLSEVLSLDEETWKSWDGLEQERFIRRLNTKLNYYQRYNEDVDRWISLAPDSDPRDNVYPVPLENLP
ncbi:vWA domain-containing protein [Xenorhabdus bovienii]|uniref:vWA domain-containing protein n=1 Tax=Xenorhabdus bovienii TaxID=40576 RepID=UPI00237C855A|nr:vWA domain-containing protein [Xenorhabdus bovienii]MDE1480863.1 VWA domain-containing protein [Xenorhabdus bovienii]MDE9430700.1 VWA domain-containing protein [Xenorhabdus bovienii]MDE9441478.1 VWA domain-containing protein [Xenorhabdus bovienii]MDE9488343.1 VWA domain-containing protein [Xenorhabdus bovienii]MDE9504722.1 VWA domain-containing protein [Xenorhabdus bovienii]